MLTWLKFELGVDEYEIVIGVDDFNKGRNEGVGNGKNEDVFY
jgi:hypothetical protein